MGPARQRAVLAVLAVSAGVPVGDAAVLDGVWGDGPPDSGISVVQQYVSRLRRVLGPGSIVRRSAGYCLVADGLSIDLVEFEESIRQAQRARRAGDLDRAEERYSAALSLWRSEPLAGVPGPAAELRRHSVVQVRLAAVEELAEVRLARGEAAAVVAELTALSAEHPQRERLAGLLMLALYRCGRQADALALFRDTRRTLVDGLGIEPGREMQDLHAAILRGDPTLLPDATADLSGPRSARVTPAQLPADVYGFAGRGDQLARLDALLAGAAAEAPTAVVISAVSGAAGVGKTALAVHWAHRVREQFPDGQLYVNLRGFDPGGQTVTPAEPVRGFLDALGVPPQRIPPSPDAQTALYRSLLADKRVLVLVDNARDADQARPLLPGTPPAMAVVTSRNQLTSLVAADGAHPLTLDLLTSTEAWQLLANRLGPDRVTAEPQATEKIITACARLPLALAIAAARAATHPGFPLATLAAELAEAGGPLDALAGGDPASEVRAVFSWSYTALTPVAARLFRLLGLHPGPDITAPAAASLAGLPLRQTRPPLAELTRASLLAEHAAGRYTFHDLLRAYAAVLAHSIDPDDQRRAAFGRMLDHYLHTAYTTDRLLHPGRDPITLTPPAPGVTPEQPADDQAMAWLTAEHPVLLAAVGHAARNGFDTHTWQLAWGLYTFLDRRGHWHDLITAWRTALDAADRLADPPAQALAHRLLARAHTRLGRYQDAYTHHHAALDLYAKIGDRTGQAHTHRHLAYVWERQGRPRQALGHARQALTLYRAAGHRRGHALTLNAVGWHHALLGNHQQALTHCRQALALFQDLGDRQGEAETWDSLGYAHHHLGNHHEAIDCYRRALDLFRNLGSRYYQTTALIHLGDTYHAAGNLDAARTAWRRALTILIDLDHPDAEGVRARLHDLDQSGPPAGELALQNAKPGSPG